MSGWESNELYIAPPGFCEQVALARIAALESENATLRKVVSAAQTWQHAWEDPSDLDCSKLDFAGLKLREALSALASLDGAGGGK